MADRRLAAAPRPASLSRAGGGGGGGGGRRVSFGTVPDFALPGPGVKAESVVEGSPAARAGLRAADVLLALHGEELADLRAFSQALRTLEPGREVEATVLREGDTLVLSVTVEAR